MAKPTKTKKAPTSARKYAPSPGMQSHIESLGIKTVPQYLDWCLQHGFKKSIDKTWQQIKDETDLVRRQRADKVLADSKNRWKRPENEILAFLANPPDPGQSSKLNKKYSELSGAYWTAKGNNNVPIFGDMVRFLLKESDCLFEAVHNNKKFIEALPYLVKYKEQWVRPFDSWVAKSHNAKRQFASFIRHLFDKYNDIPAFMDRVWFGSQQNLTIDYLHQKWFIHLGTGQNMRTASDLPVSFTKKIAHHFCQAPENYSINEAIRWGQIHAWDGNAALCKAVNGSMLVRNFQNEEFWESVIRWFIANPLLDKAHVGPICDYLENQKFTRQALPGPDGVNRLAVKQPNLSMKKRDPESLLRSVHEWHRQLGREKKNAGQVWSPCGITPLDFVEGDVSKNWKKWTTVELLNSKELTAEGKSLSHCVSSYAFSCVNKRVSIWSLRYESHNTGLERRITIEIDLANRRIVQARGKFNCRPTEQETRVIERWARKELIGLSSWL